MRFERGNEYGKLGGRPKGVRNKLDAYAYACALAHVQYKRGEPVPSEYEKTSLWIALETTLKTNPRDYVKGIISMLPKQVSFEHSKVTELPDQDLEQMIEDLHRRILEARAKEEIDQVSVKLIPHAKAH